MSKRRDEDLVDSQLDRIARVLDRWPAGMHDLGEPPPSLPLDWPLSLADVYMQFDGARLFLEAIELVPSAEVLREGGRWRIGAAWGGELSIDAAGQVWRHDDAADEPVLDGTSLARFLAGAIDAESMLFDPDGEFAEDVFDEDGGLVPDVERARLRARVKRDPKAPGPRWALARVLAADAPDEARDLLEQVVADAPGLAWAWLDLARISEAKGELANAIDEAVAGAEAAAGQPTAGFFWAHAARLAAAAGDDARRAAHADRARAANPALVAELLAGADDNLAAGDPEAATALADLARAIAPRDLAVLDLVQRLAATRS